MQTLIAFLLALGTLVTIHEFGHYLAARWCGVKVLRFSVGMGKVIYSRKLGKDQTEWAISALPLGGYVKMLDAREQGLENIAAADLPREFCRQPVWKRMLIVVAGPLANFLLAIGLYTALYSYGVPEPVAKIRITDTSSVAYRAGLRPADRITAVAGKPVASWNDLYIQLADYAIGHDQVELSVARAATAVGQTAHSWIITLPLNKSGLANPSEDMLAGLGISLYRLPPVIEQVVAGGPAERAGLLAGDQIQTINGQPVADAIALTELVSQSAGKPLQITVQRGNQSVSVSATPQSTELDGKQVGRLQIKLGMVAEMHTVQAGLLDAAKRGAVKTWDTSIMSLRMIGKMITGEASLKNITGPITIADYAGQTSRMGLISYISFVALISISLGVMNLLPIPVLDGGHLLYYSLELITGKPIPDRFAEIAQRAGVAVLLGVMALAFFNDIVRLMS